MSGRPTLVRSPLTGTVYVLLRNGQKREVPEAEVVAVIASFLDERHLTITRDDGTKRRYIVVDDDGNELVEAQP